MTDTLAPDTPSGEEPAAKTGWLRSITGDGPLYALLILFGLNAVDELDRTAFAVLAPDIRDEFGLGFAGLLTLVAVVLAFALALQVPIAGMADRYPRVRIALIGAAMWACFSFMTGLATGIVMLGFARSGSAIGKAVNDPTHNSLLADWFDPDHRPKVYSFHRAANAVGAIIGPIMAGVLAYQFGWRTPFLVFAIPTIILVVLGLRLREPVRGAHERRLAGGDEEAAATEEAPPSYAEAWRMCWKIETLRRIFVAMPFLAVSLIGFATLASLLYEQAYGLDERARGVVAATSEPGQLIGLVIGARIATKLVVRDPALILKFLAVVSAITSALSLVFAVVPNLGVRNCRQLPDRAVPRDRRARHPRLAVTRHPAASTVDGVLDGVAVDPAGAVDAAVHRVDRRQLGYPHRHGDDGPGVPHRRPRHRQRRQRDRQRHRPGPPDRAGPGRGDEPAPPRRGEAAAVSRGQRRLLRCTGAARRRPGDRRGFGRGPARHERGGQVDAAQGDLRGRAGRSGSDHLRRSRRDPRTAERDRRPRHRPDSRWPRRVPGPHRAGEPRRGRVAATAATRPHWRPAWRRCSRRSLHSQVDSTSLRQTCRAASSRCSPWE